MKKYLSFSHRLIRRTTEEGRGKSKREKRGLPSFSALGFDVVALQASNHAVYEDDDDVSPEFSIEANLSK